MILMLMLRPSAINYPLYTDMDGNNVAGGIRVNPASDFKVSYPIVLYTYM